MSQTPIVEFEIENLRKRLEFHELFMENSSTWETFRDAEGNILYVSKEIEQILGISCQSYYSEKIAFTNYLHPEDKEEALEKFKMQMNRQFINGFICRVFDVNKNLKYLKIYSKPVYNKSNEYLGFRTSIVDITDQKKIEVELREHQKVLRDIFDSSLDNIFVIDVEANDNYRIKFINTALEKLFGVERRKIEGKLISEVVDGKSANMMINNFQKCLKNKDLIRYEEMAELSDKTIYYSTHLVPLFNEQKTANQLIGISRDITERKLSEIKLEKLALNLSQLNQDKDLFMQILAHDLRNPFNTLLGFSELLYKNRKTYSDDTIETQLGFLRSTLNSTFNLLEDLLLWYETQAGTIVFNPEIIDFKIDINILLEQQKQIAKNKNIKLTVNYKTDRQIWTDRNIFKTVLRNLVSNAIKFTPENGTVEIFTQKKEQFVEFMIIDSGVGISLEDIQQLWNSDRYTTNGTDGEKGTGLGLKLCKQFVEKSGGKIWVEYSSEKGTCFAFTMPIK